MCEKRWAELCELVICSMVSKHKEHALFVWTRMVSDIIMLNILFNLSMKQHKILKITVSHTRVVCVGPYSHNVLVQNKGLDSNDSINKEAG